MAAPLLQTKLNIPSLRENTLRRTHLLRQLDSLLEPGRSLGLIAAPAGFGKTTLIITWLKQITDWNAGWLSLDREHNDPARFLSYLCEIVTRQHPQHADQIRTLVESGAGSDTLLAQLINLLTEAEHGTLIVLDDYHEISDARIHQGLAYLVDQMPDRTRLLITSRIDPPLPLGRMRARGQLVELRANQLRFTPAETAAFLSEIMGLEISEVLAAALEDRTEGWAAGLQLAALSLRDITDPSEREQFVQAFTGSHRHVVDYLAEEVLARQSEEVHQFLLQCSILDILSGPLCEAVTELDSAAGYGTRMLNQLVLLNFFVTPLDEQHQWFRFHHLFAEFLRHKLTETHSADVPLLHRRAADWFEAQGKFDEAFRHALATGDMVWAANLMDRNIEALIERGEVSTLTQWIRHLPRKHIRQRPRLGLAYAWGLTASHQLDDARFWLDDVQQTLNGLEAEPSQPGPTDGAVITPLRGLLGALALIRSMIALAQGNFQPAAEYSREAVSYLDEGNPFIRSMLSLEESMYATLLGDTSGAIEVLQTAANLARRVNNLFVLIVSTCQLADMLALQGHLNQALATLQRARMLVSGSDQRPRVLMGIIDSGLGEILRERNQLDESQMYLERGREFTRAEWAPSYFEGTVSLARLLQSRGDASGAQTLLEEAFRQSLSTESGQWDSISIAATAVRLALQSDDLTAANRWREQSRLRDYPNDTGSEKYPYHVFEYLLLTHARYELAVGKNDGDSSRVNQALERLQAILPQTRQFKRVTSQIEILVLRAMIEDALAESDRAVHTLLSALALGEPEGYQRVFLDEGRIMAELLARCLVEQQQSGAYSPSLTYIQSLLELCGQEAGLRSSAAKYAPGTTVKTPDDVTIHLSARELEVLALIAAGKSNEEIAAQLYLALNTVKRHASNIYDKLDVKKRTEAVARARLLGLIP